MKKVNLLLLLLICSKDLMSEQGPVPIPIVPLKYLAAVEFDKTDEGSEIQLPSNLKLTIATRCTAILFHFEGLYVEADLAEAVTEVDSMRQRWKDYGENFLLKNDPTIFDKYQAMHQLRDDAIPWLEKYFQYLLIYIENDEENALTSFMEPVIEDDYDLCMGTFFEDYIEEQI